MVRTMIHGNKCRDSRGNSKRCGHSTRRIVWSSDPESPPHRTDLSTSVILHLKRADLNSDTLWFGYKVTGDRSGSFVSPQECL